MVGVRTEATSERIRAVAAELFAEHGYEKTSLREIAERLDITKAALYYHYQSKEALLQAIVRPLLDDMRALVGEAEGSRDVDGRRDFFRAYLDVLLRHRWVCALIFRDTAAVVAIVSLFEELKELALRFQVVLAGPEPTAERRVRAAAALEVLSVALASEAFLPDIPEAVLRTTLLDAATAVIDG